MLGECPTTVVRRLPALTESLVPTGSEARHLDLDPFLLDVLGAGHRITAPILGFAWWHTGCTGKVAQCPTT